MAFMRKQPKAEEKEEEAGSHEISEVRGLRPKVFRSGIGSCGNRAESGAKRVLDND